MKMEKEYLTKTMVKERGWSDTMIDKFLPKPDQIKDNPKYKCAAPMKLYGKKRVERIEAKPTFLDAKEKSAVRRIGAKKAVVTKRRVTVEEAERVPILPPAIIPKDELTRKAIQHHNNRQAGFAVRRRDYDWRSASLGDNPGLLNRLCVNYLRHQCTTYDHVLAEFVGRVGTDEAYPVIKSRVLQVIADAYHWLAEECIDQMSCCYAGGGTW